jgi:methionine-rich copper-binding protein CopC
MPRTANPVDSAGNLGPVQRVVPVAALITLTALLALTASPAAAVSPAAVSPAAVVPAAVSPAAVVPAAVSPAAVSPAVVSPAVVVPAAVSPAAVALIAAKPQVGAVLDSAPDQVTLAFDRTLASGSLTVTGPDGAAGEADAMVSGNDLTQPLLRDLPPGPYTVTWRARSDTGGPTTGSYGFSIVAPVSAPSPSPTAGAPTSPRPSATVAPAPSAPGPGAASGTVSTSQVAPADVARATAGAHPFSAATAPASVEGSPRRGPSGRVAPTVGASAPDGQTSPAETSDAESLRAEKAVKDFADDSRAIGGWLIASAVLIQAAAGLWGLWRWRRTEAAERTRSAALDRVDTPGPDAESDPWVDDLRSTAALGSRPWTGELPVHRPTGPPPPVSPPTPPSSPRHS